MGAYNQPRTKKSFFVIGSNDGTKEGRPCFRQWIGNSTPQVLNDNHKEINGKWYALFEGFSGVLEAIDIRKAEIPLKGKARVFYRIHLTISDENGMSDIEVGNYDGSYATNLFARILNPEVDLAKPFDMRPYNFIDKDGKFRIGVAVYQGGEKPVQALYKEALGELGVPEPKQVENAKGEIEWDWRAHSKKMFELVRDKLIAAWTDAKPEVTPEELEADSMDDDPMAEELSKGEIGGKLYPPKQDEPKPKDEFDDDDGLPF